MIKVFSHWLHLKTVLRILIDFIFPVTCVLLAVVLVGHRGQESIESVIIYAVVFALAMIVFNASLGLYQRSHGRTIMQTRARAVLSLYLSVPLAYGVFALLSIADADHELLLVSGLAALFGTLAHRVYTMHRRTGTMMEHRVLIFGAGPVAESVSKVLKRSDPDIQIVGYYPSPTDTEICIPGQLVLPRAQSLSDTAYALNVHEIIIAVRERRGGILPLRELLDCKLSGVNVLDLASYFERALGQIRLDSLRIGWLIFGEGFRQGWQRTFVKRLFDIVAASILLLLALPIMLVTALLLSLIHI